MSEQNDRRIYLIKQLIAEQPAFADLSIPGDEERQWQLLRGLFNVRPAAPISDEFLQVQDEYLQEEIRAKGVTNVDILRPVAPGFYIWRGDITLIKCDAIVNAANSGMTGCYMPNHLCIDNCIHTYAGIQLRNECQKIMDEQGFAEPTGMAKITPGYNLPAKYVIHTVGPIIKGTHVTQLEQDLLRNCYESCLNLASDKGLKNIVFCCISTGVFRFPNFLAGQIAVETCKEFREKNPDTTLEKIVFCTYLEQDEKIYRDIFKKAQEQ